MQKILVYFLFFIFISGCGYKPVSFYAKENIKTAYIEIQLDTKYPNNKIASKNKFIDLLSDKMGVAVLSNRDKAKTHIFMKILDVAFIPIEYKKGFISKYRATLRASFTYKTNKYQKLKSKIVQAKYDFSAKEATLYTKLQRDEKSLSVNEASYIAIEKFITSIII